MLYGMCMQLDMVMSSLWKPDRFGRHYSLINAISREFPWNLRNFHEISTDSVVLHLKAKFVEISLTLS